MIKTEVGKEKGMGKISIEGNLIEITSDTLNIINMVYSSLFSSSPVSAHIYKDMITMVIQNKGDEVFEVNNRGERGDGYKCEVDKNALELLELLKGINENEE